MQNRISYIDRTKGFTILLVVMGHVYLFSMGDSQCIIKNLIGSFHMCLFMFLSGLVSCNGISHPYWNFKKLGKKVIGLLIPMMVFGVLFSMTFCPEPSFHSFIERVAKFINAPEKAGYWYLMSLSVFYMSLQIFRLNKWNNWIVDVLIALFTFVGLYLGWKYTAQKNDPFCLLDCANNYSAFIFGVFTAKYNLIDRLFNNNWLFFLALLGYSLLIGYVCPIHAVNSTIKHIIIPLCAIIIIVTIFIKRQNENTYIDKLLEYIGKNTLDVYVLHYFLVTNINLTVADRWLQQSNNMILSTIMVLLVSMVITFISIGVGWLLRQNSIINKLAYGRF